MIDELRADSTPLATGAHVGVANEVDIVYRLASHHSDQVSVNFAAEEDDSALDLAAEVFHRHVRLVPAVSGNDAAISDSGIVDDLENRFEIRMSAGAKGEFA